MNVFFLSAALLLAFISSSAEQRNQHIIKQKQDTMRRFDEQQYKGLPTDEKTGFYKMGNGNLVQVINKTDHHGYVERINKYPSPYTIYREYHSDDLLKIEGQFFYNFNIGKWTEYDSHGNLLKETDKDEPYPFTLKKLIEKVKKEFFIDLEDKRLENEVNRFQYEKLNNHPFYEIKLRSKEHNLKRDYILIDGISGEVLYKTFYYLKQGGTPFDDYLKQKNSHSIK
jgi:hypothetical protein